MRDHKSLVAWQQAHAVVQIALRCRREYWTPSAAAVFDQLQRATLSVQLNLAEGYALRAPRRFHYHLLIAYGSAVETIDLLELLLEERMVPDGVLRPGLIAANRTRGLLLGLMRRYKPDGKT